METPMEPVTGHLPGLPVEMWQHVFGFLTNSDKLNAAMTCTNWLMVAESDLPVANALCISIGNCECRVGTADDGDLWLQLCQCENHGATTILSWLLPRVATGTKSLCLEDDLLHGERIRDDSIHALLTGCAQGQLKKVQFNKVDFAAVRPWTLALLAKCDHLEEVHFEDCILPESTQSESLLIRSIFPSFATLTHLHVINCSAITDKLARSVARSCPLLESFSVQGCKYVTSFSILSLIESAHLRKPAMLTVYVGGTSFDVQQLDRQMRSPLFMSDGSWRLRQVTVQLGFERNSLMAESTDSMCVLIHP